MLQPCQRVAIHVAAVCLCSPAPRLVVPLPACPCNGRASSLTRQPPARRLRSSARSTSQRRRTRRRHPSQRSSSSPTPQIPTITTRSPRRTRRPSSRRPFHRRSSRLATPTSRRFRTWDVTAPSRLAMPSTSVRDSPHAIHPTPSPHTLTIHPHHAPSPHTLTMHPHAATSAHAHHTSSTLPYLTLPYLTLPYLTLPSPPIAAILEEMLRDPMTTCKAEDLQAGSSYNIPKLTQQTFGTLRACDEIIDEVRACGVACGVEPECQSRPRTRLSRIGSPACVCVCVRGARRATSSGRPSVRV